VGCHSPRPDLGRDNASLVHKKRGRKGAPFFSEQRTYLFFAAFFFPPFAFFAIEEFLPSRLDCGVVPQRPALSAAWHVGPELSDLASWANSRCANGESGEQQLYW
jgi:hypothetical protein